MLDLFLNFGFPEVPPAKCKFSIFTLLYCNEFIFLLCFSPLLLYYTLVLPFFEFMLPIFAPLASRSRMGLVKVICNALQNIVHGPIWPSKYFLDHYVKILFEQLFFQNSFLRVWKLTFKSKFLKSI